MSPTVTVFRRWPSGEILALFPGLPGATGYEVLSYEHTGQHSAADYQHCIAATRPATPAQYRPLARELRRIGYRLAIRQRAQYRDFHYAQSTR